MLLSHAFVSARVLPEYHGTVRNHLQLLHAVDMSVHDRRTKVRSPL